MNEVSDKVEKKGMAHGSRKPLPVIQIAEIEYKPKPGCKYSAVCDKITQAYRQMRSGVWNDDLGIFLQHYFEVCSSSQQPNCVLYKTGGKKRK